MKQEPYNKIKGLIGANETLKAFNLLEQYAKLFDNSVADKILILKSRFERNKNNQIINSISAEEFSREMNSINNSLLELMKPENKSIIKIISTDSIAKNKIRGSIYLFFLLLACLIFSTGFVIKKYTDVYSSILDIEQSIVGNEVTPIEKNSYEETLYLILDSYSCNDLNSASDILRYRIHQKCK